MKLLKCIGGFILNIAKNISHSINKICHKIKDECLSLYRGTKDSDIFVLLSMLIISIGYFRRKQWIKGIIYTAFQSVFIVFLIMIGIPTLSKFSTLGSVAWEQYYDPAIRDTVTNNYDNSFTILLFSLFTILFIFIYIVVLINSYKKQIYLFNLEKNGEHIPSFKEEIKEYLDKKFFITLLALPVVGVVIFTIIPLVFMFLVAFTNYDLAHSPPINLFTWVGFRNFQILFNIGGTNSSFGYSFGRVISWTVIWSLLATITTYIGGILLAIYINSKLTKWPKLWRTLFVITIAVPQFVSLLLVRNFFATTGIANTLAEQWGILDFLKNIGLVKSNLSYIPFLTDEIWSKSMIILINCWIGFPYLMLIATGILMNIPKELYESAKIDGANKFQLFVKITMPYMLFVTAPYLITQFIQNMNNFNVIYLLTSNRVTSDQLLANVRASDTDLLITWLFKLTQEEGNYKMASTIGVVLFLVTSILTLVAFNQTIKGDKEERFQ